MTTTSLTPQQRWYRRKKKKQYNVQYYLKNKETILEGVHQRRAQKAGNVAIPYKRSDVIAKYGMCCHICQMRIDGSDLTLDHVIPIKKGGADVFENVKPAHASCNKKKGDKIVT